MVKATKTDYEVDFVFKDLYEIKLNKTLQKVYGVGTDELLANKSKLISDKEIHEIIEVLHPHYKELKMSISLQKSRFQLLFGMLNPFNDSGRRSMFMMAFKRTIAGNHRQGKITLFPFNYNLKNVPNEHKLHCYKLLIVFSLLHEIRHAYQWTYKTKKYNKSSNSYIPANQSGYNAQWIERDANKFAQRIMNKNKQNINKVLGIDFEWECRWGLFDVNF